MNRRFIHPILFSRSSARALVLSLFRTHVCMAVEAAFPTTCSSLVTGSSGRNNHQTKARAEEREQNIGWRKRLFAAWRESHAERKEDGEDHPEEDETPVVIPSTVVSCHDAPEGDPSASIIREGTSVRRESGPEQRHDLAANDWGDLLFLAERE